MKENGRNDPIYYVQEPRTAGITRLPGTHVMVGYSAIAPQGTFDLQGSGDAGWRTSTTTKAHVIIAP